MSWTSLLLGFTTGYVIARCINYMTMKSAVVKTITVASTPKSFAGAILSILTSHNKNEKELDRVRQLIKKKYTWDKIGDDLNNIIDSLEENINDRARS